MSAKLRVFYPGTDKYGWVSSGERRSDEGEVPMLARKILRMRRDKAPYDEICRMAKPLFKSIIGSAITQDWVPDPKSGLSEFEIKQTPQLKALLRKLRTPSNPL